MLLTSRIVRAARPRERRYILADEHGMSLHVMPWGSKWWRFRYRFQHTERMISLGVYPFVNLAIARLLHADARGLLARDIDPSVDRKERRAANARTFEGIARQWFKLLEPRVAKGQLAADTLKDATRILERHVFPTLGARPISHIRAHELLMVLKQIELKGLRDSARRANAAAVYFDTPSAWAMSSATSLKICGVFLSLPRFATVQALPILLA